MKIKSDISAVLLFVTLFCLTPVHLLTLVRQVIQAKNVEELISRILSALSKLINSSTPSRADEGSQVGAGV
jgi:hypothetical protein